MEINLRTFQVILIMNKPELFLISEYRAALPPMFLPFRFIKMILRGLELLVTAMAMNFLGVQQELNSVKTVCVLETACPLGHVEFSASVICTNLSEQGN